MTVEIQPEAIVDLASVIARFPAAVKAAARPAVNDAARYAVRIGTDRITREVNFPKGYLQEPGRFAVSVFAQGDDLRAVVTARGRSTSLRRFAVGSPTPESTRGFPGQKRGSGPGVTVEVKPGQRKLLPGAFILRLKRGAASISDDSFNLGLAIRLRPGEVLPKKYKYTAVQLTGGIYILYGPSVAQAFDTVKLDIAGEVASELTRQFRRQFGLVVAR